ncbi:MAG: peptidylprolyl isomerase [Zoogloeaceae bacterium]|nr:peptidylprolyl isomerase [Zoogloeaceae bacterium]
MTCKHPAGLAVAFVALALAMPVAAAQTPGATPEMAHHRGQPYLARIGDRVISARDYETELNGAAKQKFYHGQPPEAEVLALQRDVALRMVDRILLLDEAQRRGIKPDGKAIQATLDGYDARYQDSERWQRERERLIPGLKKRLEEESLLTTLEQNTRRIPNLKDAAIRAYYDKHPEKFTEPEKIHLGMILLQVLPSSASNVWAAAEEEAGRLAKRLQGGADFAELARLHSADESSAKGGDLGYLHRGIVPEALQGSLDSLQPGQVSAPLRVLQGVALFRMIDRVAPVHHPYAAVRERARSLLERERSEQAWTDYRAGLRAKAKLEVNAQRYPALADLGKRAP